MRKIYVSEITLNALKEQDLTFREKLAISEKLDSIKVDFVELPSLNDNKENEIIYRTISENLNNATISINVGADDESFELAVKCIKNAKKACLQVALPISTAQMEYFYHVKAPAMKEKIANLVKKASGVCGTVEFVALDVFRAEASFLTDCVKTATENGASIITLCDSEGVALPQDFANLVKQVKSTCDAKVFVEPSNALSLASACVIESINAGADGVKTSTCGNYMDTSIFAEIIRAKKFVLDVESAIDVSNANTVSKSINNITVKQDESVEESINVDDTIKTDASIKDVSMLIKKLGYELTDSDVGKVYEEFKRITLKKETVKVKELEALVASTAMQVPSTYHLVNFVVNSGNIIQSTANVTLEKDGQKFTGVSTGDGPIDAAFHAIEQIIGHHYELDDFQVNAVTKGRGAVGSSIIRLRAGGKLYSGNGVSTDIIGACIRAYINALNKIVYEEK